MLATPANALPAVKDFDLVDAACPSFEDRSDDTSARISPNVKATAGDPIVQSARGSVGETSENALKLESARAAEAINHSSFDL